MAQARFAAGRATAGMLPLAMACAAKMMPSRLLGVTMAEGYGLQLPTCTAGIWKCGRGETHKHRDVLLLFERGPYLYSRLDTLGATTWSGACKRIKIESSYR